MFADSKDKGLQANPISVCLVDAVVQRTPHKVALIGFAIAGLQIALLLTVPKKAFKHLNNNLLLQISKLSANVSDLKVRRYASFLFIKEIAVQSDNNRAYSYRHTNWSANVC
ncbi:hypothetical protein LCGC14_1398900 [marine sediment metagenome]|uniref:Uncharacterized protein n=1 Tax=marine sediment metagenome TaxID=412755 RepID=A0A0F9KIK1_9ZZZZ|nr:hypothetical protein [Actinomycetota bacterium]